MSSTSSNVVKFIRHNYNIFIDVDKIQDISNKLETKTGKETISEINMFCQAIFGIDFITLKEMSNSKDWINFQEEKCTIRQNLQKRLIDLEQETSKKIAELEIEIQNLSTTNEELRTSYWNLKHNV
jgi:hypothetical protein